MDKYVKFYNDPSQYNFKREKYAKDISTDLKFQTSKKVGRARSEGNNIVLEYPVEFTGDQVSGTVDFGI